MNVIDDEIVRQLKRHKAPLFIQKTCNPCNSPSAVARLAFLIFNGHQLELLFSDPGCSRTAPLYSQQSNDDAIIRFQGLSISLLRPQEPLACWLAASPKSSKSTEARLRFKGTPKRVPSRVSLSPVFGEGSIGDWHFGTVPSSC